MQQGVKQHKQQRQGHRRRQEFAPGAARFAAPAGQPQPGQHERQEQGEGKQPAGVVQAGGVGWPELEVVGHAAGRQPQVARRIGQDEGDAAVHQGPVPLRFGQRRSI